MNLLALPGVPPRALPANAKACLYRFALTVAAAAFFAAPASIRAQNFYAANFLDSSVDEYNLSTSAPVTAFSSAGVNGPIGLVLSGNVLYVANHLGSTLNAYDATTGAPIAGFAPSLNNSYPWGLVLSGNTLYVSFIYSNLVEQYDATTGADLGPAQPTSSLNGPTGLALSGNNLYSSNFFGGTVGAYDLTTGNPTAGFTPIASPNTNLGPNFLLISGSHLYAGFAGYQSDPRSNDGGMVGEYDLATGAPIFSFSVIGGLKYPTGMQIVGNTLYVADAGAGTLGTYDATTGAPISSVTLPTGPNGASAPYGLVLAGTSSSATVTVPGTANPWLAPAGATDGDGDSIPAEAPIQVASLALTPGATLTFAATGLVNNTGDVPNDPPDGSSQLFPHPAENGLSGVLAAVDGLVGVFIDDSPADPTNATAPATLDYSDSNSVPGGLNFNTLPPKLRQVFFIGDGKNASGATQQVTVPAGATHLFLGTMDGAGWYNNTGSFRVTVTSGTPTLPPANGAVLTVNPDDLSYTVEGQGTTGQVVPGDKIDYSLTVRNTGTAPATNLVVQGTYDPANTKLKKVSDGGTASGSVITWTLPSLENGDHHTFTFSAKVKPDVDTRNGIHTDAGVHSAGSNDGSVYIDPTKVPEIALLVVPLFNISVSNNGASTAPGGQLTFTFAITNRGSDPISNISAYVPLPEGYVPANFKTAQLIDGNGNPVGIPFKLGAAINGGIDQNAVLVTVPSLAAGQVQQFIVTVNVPYSAPPSSDVTLPVVQLTGYQSDGSQVTFGQNTYVAQISNQPPAALPNLALLKIVPTAGNIQTLQALANLPPGSSTSPLFKAAKQLFTALAASTGISTTALLATPPDQLAQLLNPYVSRDTDPTSGDSLFDVPSPNAKQTAPYVTYLLLYFNAGDGAAAGITISDAVASGLQLDPTSINVKGAALTSTGSVVGSDGRSLTFTFGQIKSGVGGAILYRAFVPAPGAGGPNLGDTIQPVTASLTTASLSNQVFDTPLESLLITGKANCLVDASESDPGDGTAVYNIYYRNTGGQKSDDLIIVSEVPAGGAFVSADFLDLNQNVISGSFDADGTKRISATQFVEPIASGTISGHVVFHLGKVKARDLGFVQVRYQLTAAGLTHSTAGLTHHYYVDGSSFPGLPAVNAARVGQPIPRVVGHGPQPRGVADLLGAFKAGIDNIGHALGNFIRPGSFPTVAPTIWVSRVAPLAVQEDTDFSYFITVGNCGTTTAFDLIGGFDLPSGATFKSGTGGTFITNESSFLFHLASLPAGQSQTFTITLHATAKAGSSLLSYSTGFSAFGTQADDYPTGYVTTGKTSTFVYSAAQAATFDDLKTSIVTSVVQANGIDPTALTGGLLFPSHLAALTPQSTQTTIAHADYLTTTTGATIVAQGGGNIVAQGGGNIVAQGGGNIVAQGGGNIVAQGGGNILLNNVTGFSGAVSVANLFSAQGLATIVAQGGGNIVAQGGGNIVAQGGGNIIDFQTGSTLISTSALQFKTIAAAGFGNALSENLIGQDGNQVVSNDGGSITSQDGSGIVSQTGGGLYADGGAALLGTGNRGVAQRVGGKPIRRTTGVPAGTTLGSPSNSVHLDFNNAGSLVFGVGGNQIYTQIGGN